MIIDDAFLSPEEVAGLEATFLGQGFPWNYSGFLIQGDEPYRISNIEPYKGSQFSHLFYSAGIPQSEHTRIAFDLLNKFCDKHGVQMKAVLRAKANLTVQDFETTDSQTPHIDHSFPHYVFLYYINDSDGDTILYDKTYSDSVDSYELHAAQSVSPKAGRAIMFDGLNFHSPQVPQQHGYRAVINITFL